MAFCKVNTVLEIIEGMGSLAVGMRGGASELLDVRLGGVAAGF